MNNISRKVTLFISMLIFLSSGISGADVVELKNRRRVEGVIVRESEKAVVMDIGIGEVTIARNDIKKIERKEADNAAIFYMRATEMATFTRPGDDKTTMDNLKDKGWTGDEKEVGRLLDENRIALGELEKAVAIDNCDFYFEEKYKFGPIKEPMRNEQYPKIDNLHWLFLLNGKYYENRKESAAAVEQYLNAVKYLKHISKSEDPYFKVMALKAEDDVYASIKNFLDSESAADKALSTKIYDALIDYEKQHFTAKELAKAMKEFFLARLQYDSHSLTVAVRTDAIMKEDMRAKIIEFARDLSRYGAELADKHYGNMIKAAETASETDWKAMTTAYDNDAKDALKKDIKDDVDMDHFLDEQFDFSKIKDPKEIEKKETKKIVITIMTACLPGDRSYVEKCRPNEEMLKKLNALAEAKSK